MIDRRTAVLLTLPPLFWAGNAVVARMIVGQFPPLALSLLRWVVALAILLPFSWRALRAQRDALRAHWKTIALIGVIGVGGYNTFQYLAVQTSTALNVTLIASSTPVFVLVVGALAFGEHPRGAQIAGALLSIAGVLVVLSRGDPVNLLRVSFVAGDLIMLAANLTWTIYTWLLRKRRPAMPFAPFLSLQMMFGVLAIAPFAAAEALVSQQTVQWNAATALALLYVATLPSLVAYYCWDRGVVRVGAVIPVSFANLTPLFAAALSTALLGEAPHPYHVVALVLIVGGIHLAARSAAGSGASARSVT